MIRFPLFLALLALPLSAHAQAVEALPSIEIHLDVLTDLRSGKLAGLAVPMEESATVEEAVQEAAPVLAHAPHPTPAEEPAPARMVEAPVEPAPIVAAQEKDAFGEWMKSWLHSDSAPEIDKEPTQQATAEKPAESAAPEIAVAAEAPAEVSEPPLPVLASVEPQPSPVELVKAAPSAADTSSKSYWLSYLQTSQGHEPAPPAREVAKPEAQPEAPHQAALSEPPSEILLAQASSDTPSATIQPAAIAIPVSHSSPFEDAPAAMPHVSKQPVVAVREAELPPPAPAKTAAPASGALLNSLKGRFTNYFQQMETAAQDGQPAPQAKKPAAPAPTVAEKTQKPLPPTAGRTLKLSVPFAEAETSLPPSSKEPLDAFASELKNDDTIRATLVAYASAGGDQASVARRVSLARALAVRAYLIDQGISNLRISVLAQGNKNAEDAADRVDIFQTSLDTP